MADITSHDFAKLIAAMTKIADRTTLSTVVQPPPLSKGAQEAADLYALIAGDLRTVFEVPSSS